MSKVAQLRQRIVNLTSKDQQQGSKEAKLAAVILGLEEELDGREAELRATNKAANNALGKQDVAMRALTVRNQTSSTGKKREKNDASACCLYQGWFGI
jgi:hypothetical protein